MILTVSSILSLGFTSGIGFALAGMTNPGSLLNFMDFRRIPGVGEYLQSHFGRSIASPANWDPSVLVVFASALATQLPLYQFFIKGRKKSLFGSNIAGAVLSGVSFRLVAGAALFGAGWALAGFCPGPALASAFAGAPRASAFLGTVLLGMLTSALVDAKFNISQWLTAGRNTGLVGSLAGMGILSAGLALFRHFATPLEALSPVRLPLDPVSPLKYAAAGGALIGLSGFAYMLAIGKTMGLSGMLSHHFDPATTTSDRLDRWVFLGGLAASALFARFYYPAVFISTAITMPLWKVLLSGFMVGFGTAFSNGCTSGHGLAGISRFAVRSVVATATFFATNVFVSTFVL